MSEEVSYVWISGFVCWVPNTLSMGLMFNVLPNNGSNFCVLFIFAPVCKISKRAVRLAVVAKISSPKCNFHFRIMHVIYW